MFLTQKLKFYVWNKCQFHNIHSLPAAPPSLPHHLSFESLCVVKSPIYYTKNCILDILLHHLVEKWRFAFTES